MAPSVSLTRGEICGISPTHTATSPEVPSLLGTKDWLWGGQVFHGPSWGDGLGPIQAHCINHALYFSSNAAADLTGGISPEPRGWGTPGKASLINFAHS